MLTAEEPLVAPEADQCVPEEPEGCNGEQQGSHQFVLSLCLLSAELGHVFLILFQCVLICFLIFCINPKHPKL